MKQRKNKKVVVYIHGLHGSAVEAEEYNFLKEEYDVVGLNYVDGNPWELKDTIRNAYEKLVKNYDEVIVIANSIGAFYAYEYLSDYKINQAFFIFPITDMSQIIFNKMMSEGMHHNELEEKKFITCEDGTVLSFEFYQYVSNCKNNWEVQTDILFGEYDEVVPIENIVNFLVTHPKAKLTIKKGAGHYFHTPNEKKFIKEWILRNL